MADDLTTLRAAVDGLSRDVRALTRAGRSQAEALAAGDAADAERVSGLVRAIEALTAKVDALKPAADYFDGRAKAEGAADGEAQTAGVRLTTATKGAAAEVLGDSRVRYALRSLAYVAITALVLWLGLVSGAAGKAQQLYSGPTPPEAADAP